MSYSINKKYAFTASEGSSQKAKNTYIIIHDVGAETGALANARYFKNNWRTAETYVAYVVGDGGKVYQVGEPSFVQWGAGAEANANAPVQIELAHTKDKATFAKDYKTFIELIRDSAKKYGIPLTLDAGTRGTKGVKSHVWVSNHIWGNHQDPYGYLLRFGITRQKLADDIAHGTTSTPSKPNTPTTPPATSGWINEKGNFKVTAREGIIMRASGASIKNAKIAVIKYGETVKYDKFCYAGGYVWIRQPRANGKFGYLPTGTANGHKRTSYWGKFS